MNHLLQLKPQETQVAFSSGPTQPGRSCRLHLSAVRCSAQTRPEGTHKAFEQRTIALAAAGAIAATILVAPLQAVAVSGGGGLGTSLAGKDFSSKDLHNQKFYKADMRGANFTRANMQGANLFGAYAKDAKFVGANLENADVESVDFEGADLTDAILAGAQATNARFKDAQLRNTDWTDAILRRDVQRQLCSAASGTNPVTEVMGWAAASMMDSTTQQ